MTKAILVNGSNTKFSRLTGVQQQVEAALQAQGIDTEVLYVHEIPAEDLILANFGSEAVKAATAKVAEADVVVLLTPIYKASYTGILKTFLDLIPQKGFENKLIFPVAIGGSIGHLLAIDYALKPVASALGASHITHTVYVVDTQVEKLEDGGYKVDTEAIGRIEHQAQYVASHTKVAVQA